MTSIIGEKKKLVLEGIIERGFLLNKINQEGEFSKQKKREEKI